MAKSSAQSKAWGANLQSLYVILAVSLTVNVILMSVLVYLYSWRGDMVLMRTALQHNCERDYDRIMENSNADGKVLFSEGFCDKDAKSGAPLPPPTIQGGHLQF